MIYLFRKEMKKWHFLLWAVLASLVLGGLSAIFFRRRHPSELKIAEVNGAEITFKQYGQTLGEIKSQIEAYRMYARMYGVPIDMFLSISGLDKPEQAAFDKCVNDKLIDQEMQPFNIEIDPEYFSEQLIQKLPPQVKDQSGGLNMEAYKFYLGRLFTTIPEFEQRKENEFRRELFSQFVETSNYVSTKSAIQAFASDNIRKKFAILHFPFDLHLEQIKKGTLDKKMLGGFYKKNKENYRVPEKRQAKYWIISPQNYAKKNEIIDEAIQNFYDKNKSTLFRIPPKVKVRHILLKIPEDAKPEQLEKILEKAGDIHKQLEQQSNKFEEFVKKYSEDKTTKDKGGIIDFFERGTYDLAFERAALRLLKPSQISDVVKTDKGYQIIQLVKRISASYKPIETVKNEIVKTIRTRKEQVALRSALERIMYEVKSDKNAISEFVAKNKLKEEKSAFLSTNDAAGDELKNMLAEKLFSVARKKNVQGYFVHKKNYILYQMIDLKESFISPFEKVEKKVLYDYYKDAANKNLKAAIKKSRREFFDKKISLKNLGAKLNLKLIETEDIKKGDEIKGLDFGKQLSEKAFILDGFDQLLTYKHESVSAKASTDGSFDCYLVKLVAETKPDLKIFQEEKGQIIKSKKLSEDKLYLSAFIASLLRNAKIEKTRKMPNVNTKNK